FEDVAQLIHACWFEFRGTIDIQILSPSTLYTAYLIFKATRHAHGFSNQAGNSTVRLVGGEKFIRTVVLSAKRRRRRIRNLNANTSMPRGRYNDHNYPGKRGDGWTEVELGEFFCNREQEGELEMSVIDVSSCGEGGLIVQWFEVIGQRGSS
ncbi:Phloem protein, partial [Parasponia andersonii]